METIVSYYQKEITSINFRIANEITLYNFKGMAILPF